MNKSLIYTHALNTAQCSTMLGWNVKHDIFACDCDVLF